MIVPPNNKFLHPNSALKLPALVFINGETLLLLYSGALLLIDCGTGTGIIVSVDAVWRSDGWDSEVCKGVAEVGSVTEPGVVVILSIPPGNLAGQTPQAPQDGRGGDDGAGGGRANQHQDQSGQHLPIQCTSVLLLQYQSCNIYNIS